MSSLFCFGMGFSAQTLARQLMEQGWQVAGTARSLEKVERLRDMGAEAVLFDGSGPSAEVSDLIARSTHMLHSIRPDENGDPALVHHAQDLAETPDLAWIGYLSTVGVYGDRGGEWVDEDADTAPQSRGSERRVAAENLWMELGERTGKAVHLFRLAGIYGPGRNQLVAVKSGKSRRIVKPGQVFNRTHVSDIAQVLLASIAKPRAGGIYNVADDMPAPPQDVVTYAAELLGVEPPPEVPFEEADLSPMGRAFYGECKRISNARIKNELGVKLLYPTYREGLKALAAEMER